MRRRRRFAGDGWPEVVVSCSPVTACPVPLIGACTLACISTGVLFAPLSEEEIAAYVASGEPLQCAGGFALEAAAVCIAGLDGCYSNVIGLSLPWLRSVLGPGMTKMSPEISG